jgi:hypothetical protein
MFAFTGIDLLILVSFWAGPAAALYLAVRLNGRR